MALSIPGDGAMMGAAAITGIAVWEAAKAYQRFAPALGDLRRADCDETDSRQRLLDADVCVGGLALLAGGAASWLSKSPVPLIVVALAMVWMSCYHRAVLNGLTPNQIEGK